MLFPSYFILNLLIIRYINIKYIDKERVKKYL